MEDYKIYGTCPICGYELCFEESEICSEANEDDCSAEYRLLKAHYAATPACAWMDCDKAICVCKTCNSYQYCENDWKDAEEPEEEDDEECNCDAQSGQCPYAPFDCAYTCKHGCQQGFKDPGCPEIQKRKESCI